MKIFCHINELGNDGWRQLRALVAAFDQVILWGPSLTDLERVVTEDPLSMDSRELLDHIGAGRVSVMGRHWWFLDHQKRQNKVADGGWSGYAWHDLDNEIKSLYLADVGKNEAARVRGFEDGESLHSIQRLIHEHQWDPVKIAIRAANELPGYKEKARRDLTAVGVSLIKDAYNHGDVFRKSGADRTFGVPRDRFLYEIFAEQAGPEVMYDSLTEQPNIPDLATFFKTLAPFIAKIQSVGTPAPDRIAARQRLENLLGDEEALRQLRSLVVHADALVSVEEPPLRRLLMEELERALHKPWTTRVKEFSQRLSFRHVFGVGLSLLAKHLNSEKLMSVSGDLIRKEGGLKPRRSLPAGYQGPIWPIYFAVDERDSIEDVRIMTELLRLLKE